jgi:hypothetical protein
LEKLRFHHLEKKDNTSVSFFLLRKEKAADQNSPKLLKPEIST